MLLGLLFPEARPAAVACLLRALWLTTGRGTLELVHPPCEVAPQLSPRAQRLLRQAQVSAW